MCGANGRIVAFPCLEATSQIERIHCGLEEKAVAANHDATPGAIRMCGENEVEGRDHWHDIILAIIGLATKVATDCVKTWCDG